MQDVRRLVGVSSEFRCVEMKKRRSATLRHARAGLYRTSRRGDSVRLLRHAGLHA